MTVTLDEPVTLGTLQLGNSGNPFRPGYTISGTQHPDLEQQRHASQITVSQGTHAIAVPVEIAGGSLSVFVNGGHAEDFRQHLRRQRPGVA